MTYILWELLATFFESGVVMSSVTRITGERYSKKAKWLSTFLYTILCTAVIAFFNSVSAFSFITMCIAFAMVVFLTHFTAKGSFLLRCTASVISYLFVIAIDYIWLFLFCMITEPPVTDTYSFRALLNPSPLRCLYLAIDKSTDILLLVLLWRFLPKLQKISRKQTVVLLFVGLSVYTVISALIALIMKQSMLTMQSAIMLSCIFSCLCVFAVIALLLINSDYQAQKQKAELLRATNKLIDDNYQQIYANQRKIAKQIHDFNHHIRTLEVLADREKAEETVRYTRSLLKTSYTEKTFCKCGNNIIDAVINCKAAEAETLSIPFQYTVDLSQPVEIDPVDICSILSNQIENALDASRQVLDTAKRAVNVNIWIKNNNTLFFRVTNYVDTNPLDTNPDLLTTKTDAH